MADIVLHAAATLGQVTDASLRPGIPAGKNTRSGQLNTYHWPEGLQWGTVFGVAQAADGSLWIAGQVGMAHFDGQSIAVMEQPDGSTLPCNAITIDHNGNVWGGNPRGIYRYDGESVIRYTQSDGLVSGTVTQLIPATDGSLWIRTEEGISRFAEDSFTTIYSRPTRRDLLTMFVESPKRIWVGTTRALIRLDAPDDEGETGKWLRTRFTTEDGLAGNKVYSLKISSTGQLWIGTSGGLTRYDGATFTNWTTQDGLSHGTVTSIEETEDGRLWIGTREGLDELWQGHFLRRVRMKGVDDLYVDREQNVWIAGETLFRFSSSYPRRSLPFITNEHRPRRLMFTRDGILWVGTDSGLKRCSSNAFEDLADTKNKLYSTGDGLAGTDVTSLLEDSQGGIWVGTIGGVSHFDGERFLSLTKRNGLPSNTVGPLAEDNQGRIWVGTAEGITIYDPQHSSEPTDRKEGDSAAPGTSPFTGRLSYLTTRHGLPHNDVTALLAAADAAVWIGLHHGPVCRWQNNVVQHFDQAAEACCFLKSGANDVYAGCGDGLYHFDGTGWNHVAACGKSKVYGLTQSAKGYLWLATSAGLKVYDGFTAHTFTTDEHNRWLCWDVLWDERQQAVILAGRRLWAYRPQSNSPAVSITSISTD
ncbi:MAG: two-component regulator propeller domain-containing protein [Fuerstiella sp.]